MSVVAPSVEVMRYGIEVVPFGAYAEPAAVVELAVAAEAAGWEALSIWDHAHFWGGVADPWVTLAAVACRTSRLRLVVGVSPVPRYRPHLLARAVRTLDALSGGRVTLGAGLGVPEDLDPVGDGAPVAQRAATTDAALPLIARWYAGESVGALGPAASVAPDDGPGVQVCPGPVQDHLPVWVGGHSTPALRRAARWDGWFAGCIDESQRILLGPERVAAAAGTLRELGAREDAAIAVTGTTGSSSPHGTDLAAAYADAGATWWFESLFGLRGDHAAMLTRVAEGPPTRSAPAHA